MRISTLIAVAVLLRAGAPGAAAAVPYAVRTWDQHAGAPSDEIDGLCQDATGYLWAITPAGLVRFDGTHFALMSSGRGAGAATGFNAMIADPSSGALVLAPHSGGLLRLANQRFEPYPLPPELAHAVASALFRAPDGALWVAFEDGTVLRMLGTTPEVFGARDGIPPGAPVQFAHDGTGRVWLAADRWLARYDHGALVAVAPRARKDAVRIASARRDGPWVTVDRYLIKMIGDQPREFGSVDTKTGAVYLQGLIEADDGALWLGSRSRGLSRVVPDAEQAVVVPGQDIATLLQDSWGNIWAGAKGGGLMRLKPGMLQHFDRSLGLTENYSLTVAQSADGTMWFANHDGGVAYLTPAGRLMTLPLPGTGWKYFSAFSLAPAAPDGMWVTSSRGLVRVAHTQVEQRLHNPPATHTHAWRVTLAAKDGTLWAALAPGKLGRLRDSHWEVFGPANGVGPDTILALAEDPAGRIWVGSEDGQIRRLEHNRFVSVPLPASLVTGAIQAIYFDPEGTCWLGTEHSGLVRLTAEAARAVTETDGLPSNNITQVIGDDAGLLWCGSHAGIFHVRRSELLHTLQTGGPVEPVLIGPDEGLREATCLSSYQPSVWKSTDGVLWFATRQGVVAIDPKKERAMPAALKASITSAAADGRPLALAGNIRIPAKTRSVELQYSVLCLSTPERVRTHYRLAGYDDDWTEGEGEAVARFTRLPPGNYRFELAADLAGVPNSESRTSLPVVVEPSWAQTLLFKLAVTLACALLIVVAVRTWSHRRLRARLARLERESAIERERARIAQNIHDDLGAGLTRISLLTQSTGGRDGRVLLEKIYGTVSELTHSMQEIVWAVNPKNDDLESLANYIAEYAQEFLTDAGIRCRVQMPALLPQHAVTAHYRHELFLSCKEALHNVVKHAGASEAVLHIGVEDANLKIVIVDNGRGMPPSASAPSPGARGGNGLPSLRARMAAFGGTCTLSAGESGGVAVTLRIPLPAPALSSA